MSVVNIVGVSSRDLSQEQLWGCNIDLAISENQDRAHALNIIGWVLGRSSPAVAVEMVSDGSVVSRVPVDVRRPDIVTAFPDIPGAERSGFRITLDASDIAPAFDLFVQAIFEDGGRIQVGAIRGRRGSLCDEVEIEKVSTVSSDLLESRLWGCNIDLPVSESQAEVYAFPVEGWVLGRSSPAVALELLHEESVFRRIPVNAQRPDIAVQYPSVPEAERSGFRATINVLGLTPEFELLARVVLQDESRILIGAIRGRRGFLRTGFRPRLQPLMVTTYGRTGSSWLMQLLGQHPHILTYRPFEYEPRIGSYWMQLLEALSEPASYLQTLNTQLSDKNWWLGQESSASELVTPDLRIQQWLGRGNIEDLMTFCQDRIEQFYSQVIALQGKSDAIYFAEKYSSAKFARTVMHELYSQPREVFLIRDLRDMVCSIFAFNAKQRSLSFGRELVSSDEEFIGHVRLHALDLLHNYHSRSSQAYLLRYEDLIVRPVETLEALLQYLKLGFTSSTIEGMIRRASEETPGMQGHRTSPDPKNSIGRWRRDLDPALQAVCQQAFGDVLLAFGYTE